MEQTYCYETPIGYLTIGDNGSTCSYKDIAIRIGNEKAVRAVGGANNKNPFLIVVLCHRVVGISGALTGYACGVDVKKYLLDLERKMLTR